MHLTWMNRDITNLISSFPLPIILLSLAVLLLVFVGLLSRIRAMVKGQASPLDYAGMALVVMFFVLVAVLLTRAAFRSFSLP